MRRKRDIIKLYISTPFMPPLLLTTVLKKRSKIKWKIEEEKETGKSLFSILYRHWRWGRGRERQKGSKKGWHVGKLPNNKLRSLLRGRVGVLIFKSGREKAGGKMNLLGLTLISCSTLKFPKVYDSENKSMGGIDSLKVWALSRCFLIMFKLRKYMYDSIIESFRFGKSYLLLTGL